MRHFAYLDDDERARLFLRPPQAFTIAAAPDALGVALGATLYCPATRPRLAADIIRRAAQGVTSFVVCLEDSVPDREVAAAERNLVTQLRELAQADVDLPMIFVRVRAANQIPKLMAALGAHSAPLAGFVVPKFDERSGAGYLDEVVAAGQRAGRRLLVMPVLESAAFTHLESRLNALHGARALLDKYREFVPAVRVGATDMSAEYGLRRAREFTVWDVRVISDVLSAIVNVFGRAGTGYVISGPVWEYFSDTERLFKPQLRESAFVAPAERALRAQLLANDLDGLIREVVLDRANGLTGKTVIHPSHVGAVHALSVVPHEAFADAGDVLATGGSGGAVASSYGNKMNESKPHTEWARRTLLRAQVFGVAREGVRFVDLLGAGLHA